jgi:hypothetical protein
MTKPDFDQFPNQDLIESDIHGDYSERICLLRLGDWFGHLRQEQNVFGIHYRKNYWIVEGESLSWLKSMERNVQEDLVTIVILFLQWLNHAPEE